MIFNLILTLKMSKKLVFTFHFSKMIFTINTNNKTAISKDYIVLIQPSFVQWSFKSGKLLREKVVASNVIENEAASTMD